MFIKIPWHKGNCLPNFGRFRWRSALTGRHDLHQGKCWTFTLRSAFGLDSDHLNPASRRSEGPLHAYGPRPVMACPLSKKARGLALGIIASAAVAFSATAASAEALLLV